MKSLSNFSSKSYKLAGPRVFDMVGFNPLRKFALDFAEIEKQNKNSINLAVGVPINPTPKVIIDAKIKFVENSGGAGNNGYMDPRGMQPLRENLSKQFNQNYNSTMSPEQIIITPGGTSNSLCLAMEALLRHTNFEGEIIVIAPFFGVYTGMIKLAGGQPVYADTDAQFNPVLDNIRKAYSKNTKAIIVNSPNNPSGKVYTYEQMKEIIELAKELDIAVISDEIYEKFCFEKTFTSLAQFFDSHKDMNLVISSSPSKTYGLIGDRVGYLIGNQQDFVTDVTITVAFRFASMPYLGNAALNAVFDPKNQTAVQQYLTTTKQDFKDKADFLVGELRSMGFNTNDIEGGMFLMVEVKECTGMNGTEFSQYVMSQEDAPVAISPGKFFGQNFENYVRFTTCPTMETIVKGVAALKKYVRQIKEKN